MKTDSKKWFLAFLMLFLFLSPAIYSQTVSTGHPTSTYLVGGSHVVIAPALTITGGTTMNTATISIQSFQSGDRLECTDSNGLTPTYNNNIC